MGNKNLDKLFQEKFSDFKEIPDEKVWRAISASLDKKKSRKPIPFWWKIGGVAAVLAVLFSIIIPFKNEQTSNLILTDSEKVDNEESTDKVEKLFQFQENEISTDEIQIVGVGSDKNNQTQDLNDKPETNINAKQSNDVVSKNNQLKSSQLASFNLVKTVQKNKANVISKENQTTEDKIKAKDAVVDFDKEKSEENMLQDKLNDTNSIDEGVAKVINQKMNTESIDASKKKSIYEEIEKQKDEENAFAENSNNKWLVGANVAPVYFNSFGEGSSIDPALSTNSKSGNFNMSYGLSVAYGLSKKLSIRTGINRVDYSYNTNEVEFSASLQGSLSGRLNNVNYSESAENVVIESKSANGFALTENKTATDVLANDISRNGIVAQEFGYLEVPVELGYAVVDKRFGLNVVGGISSMFLTNNSVALDDSNQSIELGQANNLNSLNFSTNVGFGLNYKFTPKLILNLEPIFKYQLNTFSETSGSFNPFSVGVYSGLNFKF